MRFLLCLLVAATVSAETAIQSDLVADEVGVDVHFAATPYSSHAAALIQLMKKLGIRHYRDGIVAAGTQALAGAAGLKADYLVNTIENATTCPAIQSFFERARNAEYIEAPNEPDNAGDANWVTHLLAQMRVTWNCIQANYPNVRIYGPAFVNGLSYDKLVQGGTEYSSTPTCRITTNGAGYSCFAKMRGSGNLQSVASISVEQGQGAAGDCTVTLVGGGAGAGSATPTCSVAGGVITAGLLNTSIQSYLHYSNTHNYQAGFCPECSWGGPDAQGNPYANFAWQIDRAHTYAPAAPIVGTESGYFGVVAQNGGIPESVGAVYFPRLILNAVLSGFKHEYIYELLDEYPLAEATCNAACIKGSSNAREWTFGLVRNDLSPKPSATALMNMIHLLADPGSSFTPGSLRYTLSGNTAKLNHLLLQKRDGKFYLALWLGVSGYDVNRYALTSVNPQNVTITIAGGPTAHLYSQLDHQGGMRSTAAGGTSVSLSVSDAPSFLQIF